MLLTGCATTTNTAAPIPGRVVPPNQDRKLAVYNVAFGAVVGGVGALLHGGEEPVLRRVAKGLGWGALGGTVAYAGKWTVGEIGARERLVYGLPARFLHDTGLSMVENVAQGRRPLERVASHLAFVRVDVTPRRGQVQARLLPMSALAFGIMLARSTHRFDLGRSLAYGTPLFLGEGAQSIPRYSQVFAGYAFLSTVYMDRDFEAFHELAAHELIHTLQHHEFVRAGALFRAPLDSLLQGSRLYQTLGRWVYLDAPLLQWGAYEIIVGGARTGANFLCYFDNWLEREAEAFGTRKAVGVCP